ncbi:beta- -glucosidase, partial [Colletotrichum incanum]
QEIASQTGFTVAQVKQALKSSTAQPRSGRPPALSQQEEEQLVEYVTSSQQGRLASFLQLSVILFNGIYGEYTIRSTLRRLGFRRYVARQKPILTEDTRQKRLAWALAHINWTPWDWIRILWTDETWVLGGNHRKVYVTRRADEELDPTCIIQRPRKRPGWMFWGSFAGNRKGPGIVWDMDRWGTISAASYQEHIVPSISDFICQYQQETGIRLALMQDGASSHTAFSTLQNLDARGIEVIDFPPYSPDLNPIEPCWNWIKDYIQINYGHIQQPPHRILYGWVKEAWDALPDEFCARQLLSMRDRCQAVIDANGGHTRF